MQSGFEYRGDYGYTGKMRTLKRHFLFRGDLLGRVHMTVARWIEWNVLDLSSDHVLARLFRRYGPKRFRYTGRAGLAYRLECEFRKANVSAWLGAREIQNS